MNSGVPLFYEPAEASPYEPEALPSIPQGTPEAPQHVGHVAIWEGSEPSIVEETYKWKQIYEGMKDGTKEILKSESEWLIFPK